jgi:FAD:protein FMN transferase
MIQRQFAAMGTDVELLLDAPSDARANAALERARAEFERLEEVMSRFRTGSELSRLNRAGRIEASPDLARVVELALEARAATGGLFDPTVHDAVLAAGYDRTFGELREHAADEPTAARCGGSIDLDGRTIELEPGTHLDLGGIGKGYAVDRVAEQLAMHGSCLVNAGGDLAVRGGAWPVGVTDEITLELTRGAVATSGRDRRRWLSDGEKKHHLIDPASGRPAESEYLRVTVVGETAVQAEVLAKVAFLGGEVDAPRVLVTADGRTLVAGGL